MKIINAKIFSGLVIIMTVGLSLLVVNWHHQMFNLYGLEIEHKKANKTHTALNKQLLMERSELFSGMVIYEKSKNILLMRSPDKIQSIAL